MNRTLLATLVLSCLVAGSALGAPPNFVLIFCDDLGYGDLGCYGSTRNRTPHIDRLSRDGMRFTDFYSSSPVCTPSRASLLTGCYPRRVGMHEDFTGHWVLIPRSRRGLHPDEVTLAEILKSRGYATACIGKWHLGDQAEHLPTRHGFDHYYGIPYSNDMQSKRRGDPPLPLVQQEKVIEAPADQATLTRRYTEQAIAFIEANRSQPFFLYLPHTFPHLPLFASPKFHGKSANGRYGDSVEEIDDSTGQILACLDRLKLAENTLVIFTSDNGSNGRNGGSNQPLAGAKGSTMEGGMRVPMIARWPGRIPAASTCSELTTTMDVLPTFCRLAGAKLAEAKIDGFDIRSLLFGEKDAASPYEAFYYYRRRQLQAVRQGDWKYHLPLEKIHPSWTSPGPTRKGRPGKLVNLRSDLKETTDVSKQNPDVLKRMQELAERAMARLGNDEHRGSEQRKARTLPSSTPMVLAAADGVELVGERIGANWTESNSDHGWRTVSEVFMLDEAPKTLQGKPGRGVMFVDKPAPRISNLLTRRSFGDVELHVEFLVPHNSNSGVYLMGRYEIQILDSHGKESPGKHDCGAIYERWDPRRGKGKEGFEGHPPPVNASLPPGTWQTFDITFRAPRFDPGGQKTKNARFVRVVHNGTLLHEDVELTGPTRAASFRDERPTGPLMLQGDHGHVAYRNIRIQPMSPAK